jgi:hypothetical protein
MHLPLTVTLIFSVALINIAELKDCGTDTVNNNCKFLNQETCNWTILNGWGVFADKGMYRLELPNNNAFGLMVSKKTCKTPDTPPFCFEFYYNLSTHAELNVYVVADEGLKAASHLWSWSSGDGYATIPINSHLPNNQNTSYVIFVEAKRLKSTGMVFVANFTFSSTESPCELKPAEAKPTDIGSTTTTINCPTNPTTDGGSGTTNAGSTNSSGSSSGSGKWHMHLTLSLPISQISGI